MVKGRRTPEITVEKPTEVTSLGTHDKHTDEHTVHTNTAASWGRLQDLVTTLGDKILL